MTIAHGFNRGNQIKPASAPASLGAAQLRRERRKQTQSGTARGLTLAFIT
jgi:hypothetical protein